MNEEILYIDDGELVYYINDNEFITCDEIPQPMLEGIKHLQQKVEQLVLENEQLRTELNTKDNKIKKLIYNEEYIFSKSTLKNFTYEGRTLLDNNFKELANKINELIDNVNQLKEKK